ncbi:DNA primase small subunit [Spathaspora sp. JA1]|nr:DNA primase small subunit [Spathaspora sp. JA1]
MSPVVDNPALLKTFNDNDTPKSTKPSESDMIFYYQRLLPFRQIFQWLNHSPKPTTDFTRREFAYEYRNGAYQRYNSFSTLEEFKNSVIKANPTRFEIGAIYNIDPKERKNVPKSAMKPRGKELVFDIDLTDYDDIRTCCSGTDICTKCWKFIQVGSEIIESALREDFGFKNLIWVFSGRRGAHCWISDSRARNLDENIRKSIIDYLDVLGSKGKNSNRINIKKPFHPHIERSFNILKNRFSEVILEEQNPWLTSMDEEDNTKAWVQIEELLSFIPHKQLQIELRNKWKSQNSSSRSKWDDINKLAKQTLKSNIQVNQLNEAKKDIIIYYMYPRLDVEVSRQVIHLLKSPFCIHPSTGNVCVPFDITKNISGNPEDDQYGFNPTNSPNLRQLQNELELNQDSETGKHPYENTSLKPYIDYFTKFVNELVKQELKGVSKRDREDNMEF